MWEMSYKKIYTLDPICRDGAEGPRKSRDNRIAAVIVGVGHGEP